MNYKRWVVEATPRIYFSDVKDFVSSRHNIVQLALTQQDGQRIQYSARTASTSCHFGGRRYWFQCDKCGRRAGVLYLSNSGINLTCRLCSDVRYQIQMQSHSSRDLMRLFDVEDKMKAVFDGLQRVQFLYKWRPTKRFKQYLAHRLRGQRLYNLVSVKLNS